MTRALVFLGLLAVGMALWTIVSAEFAPAVKRAERRFLRLLMPAAGAHVSPAATPGEVPPHPRLGPLRDTPPDGITVLRPGGQIRVGGELPRRGELRNREPWQPCDPPPDPSPSMMPLTGPIPKVMP